MTMNREGLSWEEFSERVEAAHTRFYNMEITEDEYRRLLARLGFNATAIEQEVENNKPG